jgi:hypothetical protein
MPNGSQKITSFTAYDCTGTISGELYYNISGDLLCLFGKVNIANLQRTGGEPGVTITLPNSRTVTTSNSFKMFTGGYADDGTRYNEGTVVGFTKGTKTTIRISTSESFANISNGKRLSLYLPPTYIKLD